MTRIRIVISHGGETFDYDADVDQAVCIGPADLGPLLDQAVTVVKRAIGANQPTEKEQP